jgi:hypothetical protein
MGMHFGILVADLPWSEFFSLLSSKTGRFLDQGPVDNLDELDLDPTSEGNLIVAGEYRGKSYVLDTSMMMSMTGADFVAELSEEADALVIGCGAETTSGSYAFLAVRSGEVLRRYFDSQAFLSEPLDEGDDLPTEEDQPLEDLDGKGLIAALAHFGFDFDGWYKEGGRRQYVYTADESKSSEEERGVLVKGPLAERMNEHYGEYALPDDERPTIMLYTRDAVTGQIVSTQDTGLRFGDEELSDPEFWNRFWNRLAN